MKLSDEELRVLYQGTVKPFQHPDPLGYMTRALILSEGDPDFVDGDDRGFLPIRPQQVTDLGVAEVQSLENNVIATLTLDRLNFDKYGTVDNMVLATHFPDEPLLEGDTLNESSRTSEQNQFLNDIEDARVDVLNILEPRLATVEDVIKVLSDNRDNMGISKERKEFFSYLLELKV